MNTCYLLTLASLVPPPHTTENTTSTHKNLTIAPIFASHMVLPMQHKIPIWGHAKPNTTVQITFAGKTTNTQTAHNGTWQTHLPPLPPNNTGQTLKITSQQQTIQLNNILIGQIWLFSGQSNMDFPLQQATNGQEAISKTTEQKNIRICDLSSYLPNPGQKNETSLNQVNRTPYFQGTWKIPTPQNIGTFSAIAWWTGTQLATKTSTPIGLVDNSVGGSGMEAWMPPSLLDSDPFYQGMTSNNWIKNNKLSTWERKRALETTGPQHPYRPAFLYQRGIKPLHHFPFTGVVWYQGETNAEIPNIPQNTKMLTDLIASWRTSFQNPKLPFFIIQLPEIGGTDPIRQYWPQFREAQAKAVKSTPNAFLVVTKDLGWKNTSNVHQPHKKPIAERVAESILNTKKQTNSNTTH